MSFDSGSVSFRVLAGALDFDAVLESAREMPLEEIDSIRDESRVGWVGPRHLLDGDLSDENCCPMPSLLRLSLVEAQRKYPAGRLAAEVKREQLAWMKSEGRAYIPRKVRGELKQEVLARLLPDAPVGLAGIDLVATQEPLKRLIFTDAVSNSKSDALVMALVNARQSVCPVTDDLLCEQAGINPRDLKPLPFTGGHGERQTEMFGFTLGREFLMWLLWTAETAQEVDLPDIGRVAVMVDGPLVMKADDARVETLKLQGEAPTISEEFSQAMTNGMLLKRSRVTLCRPGTDWFYSFDVDADDWTFRGVKLPKPDMDAGETDDFLYRLNHLSRLWSWWIKAFFLFISLRVKCTEKMETSCFDWAFERPLAVRRRKVGR